MGLTWDVSFCVGHAAIDADHEHLFDIFNKLETACARGEACQVIDEIFVELAEYTMVHFQREEQIMIRDRMPEFAAHKAEHDRLLQHLSALIDLAEVQPETATVETLKLLRDWVAHHIMTWDQRLVRRLEHHVGRPPDQAAAV